ncbi:neural Wiskott-Aldrich syndrome protein-like [Hyposmocoma kahamanoa]|uniref:neural Wiskott-Aldrich syndrome protein-like n=1 Tax=Hyposmocoma kahamanoa TaxID=1477025 RepID=UPI000E6D931C|nr:neural Wiskott-Aldrich syndrome protein-like [Hyposmocoma kahamanoa]
MPRGENRSSILLSRDENDQVFSLIGAKCQSLATAVVQLFTTEGPGHSEWKKKDTGVLCLIKDNSKRSYFFRIYCLYRKAMIWEHEVYLQIEYKSPRPYLHTFEAEEYMTAFNFANEDEAKLLRNVLIEKIEQRKQRREERRQRSALSHRANSTSSSQNFALTSHAPRHNGIAPPLPPAPIQELPPPRKPVVPSNANSISGGYTIKSSSRKPKTRKLTKADIGMPLDFKHVSHVGWDANKGFDVDNLPEEEMRSFFSKAGISETQLQDQKTRKFIYDFIYKHGGIDAVKEDLHETKPPRGALTNASPAPPPPTTPAPPVPARSPAPHHPPAPPSRAPPPPPARVVPPPPPPPASLLAPKNPPPPRPTQPPSSAPPSVPPPPPPGMTPSGAPPPPPPPPLAPVPPPMPVETPSAGDARSALMESIRTGNKTLKKVETAPRPVIDDSRSNLLSEIRQGVELKSVTRSLSNANAAPRPSGGGCGLAEALKKALDDRNIAMHSDSDSNTSDTTSDGDEWD